MKRIHYLTTILCFLLLLFLLTGCATFQFPGRGTDEEGEGTATTATTGGRGVQVTFVGGAPPLGKIRGPFGIALQLKNYNTEEVTIDKLLVTSTWRNRGVPPIEDGPITMSAATRSGPGTVRDYYGAGQLLLNPLRDPLRATEQDEIIFYGDNFFFYDVKRGYGTSFYADLYMHQYFSTIPFSICVSLPCPTRETLSAKSLGSSNAINPVMVRSIEKRLIPSGAVVAVELDIVLEDASLRTTQEQGEIMEDAEGSRQIRFALRTVDGVPFSCVDPSAPPEAHFAGMEDLLLTLPEYSSTLEVFCTTTVPQTEVRSAYLYTIELEYPYHQRVSTPYINLYPGVQG